MFAFTSQVGITLSANTLDLSKTPYGRFEQQPLYLAFADTAPWGLSLVTRATIPAETQNNSHVCQLFQVGLEGVFFCAQSRCYTKPFFLQSCKSKPVARQVADDIALVTALLSNCSLSCKEKLRFALRDKLYRVTCIFATCLSVLSSALQVAAKITLCNSVLTGLHTCNANR